MRLSPQNPWPGLQFFTTDDAPYFAGRDREIDEVCERIRRYEHTVLFGKSGLGKTSLLRAGVIPRLEAENFFPVPIRILFAPNAASPVEQVRQALTAALLACGVEARAPLANETLWEYFHDGAERFWKGVRPCLPVLLFDQFEEFFTLGRLDSGRRERSEALLSELASLLENSPPSTVRKRFEAEPDSLQRFDFDRRDFKVVWSLREDFLPDLEGWRERFRDMGHNRFRLGPLTGEGALAAVLKGGSPLLQPGTAEEIVRRVAGFRMGKGVSRSGEGALADLQIEPALLSLMCFELNRARLAALPPASQIDAELIRNAGDRILSDFYQRSVAGLPKSVCVFIEERLLAGQGRFRQSAPEEEFLGTPGANAEQLQRLIDGRLVRREERLGTQHIELTHDVLVEPVREFREQRRTRERDAEEERRRVAAEEKVEGQKLELRRRRMVNWLLGALAVLFASLLFYSWTLRKRAESSERTSQDVAVQLAANNSLLAQTLDHLASTNGTLRSLLLSYESLSNRQERLLGESLERESVIRRLNETLTGQLLTISNLARESSNKSVEVELRRTEAVARARETTNSVFQADLSGGITLASSGDYSAARQSLRKSRAWESGAPRSEIRTRDLMDGFLNLVGNSAVRTNFSVPGALFDIASLDDGRRLAVIGERGRVWNYDPATGSIEEEVRGSLHEGNGRAIVWDAQGTGFLSGGDDQILNHRSADSGALISQWRAPGQIVSVVREGKRLAVGCADGSVAIGTADPELKLRLLEDTVPGIAALSLSRDGRLLVAVCDTGDVRIWELTGGEGADPPRSRIRRSLRDSTAVWRSVAFDRDGEGILLGDDHGRLELWSSRTGEKIRVFKGHRNRVTGIATVEALGRLQVISGGWDKVLRIWDLKTGMLNRVLDGPDQGISGLAVSSRRCFAIDLGGRCWEWRPFEEALLRFVPVSSSGNPPTAVAIIPDGSGAVVGFGTGGLQTISFQDGGRSFRKFPEGDGARVTRIAFLPGGTDFVSTDTAGRIRRWSLAGEAPGVEIGRSPGPLHAVAVSRDGGRIVAAGSAGPVRLRAQTDQLIRNAMEGAAVRVVASPLSMDVVRMFRTNAWSVEPAAADHTWILSGADAQARQILFWRDDLPGVGPVEVRTHGLVEVAWAAQSPDGAWVAAGGKGGALSLTRIGGTSEPLSLGGHENSIVRLAFSPEGEHLFTVATDGTVRGWEVPDSSGNGTFRNLFVLLLASDSLGEEVLFDFDFLGRDRNGNAWIVVPLARGDCAVAQLGAVYR